MPIHPSTQVTHIPEVDVIDSSVLFLVRVALEVFPLEKDIYRAPFWT
jgi:hypothetical protein